ncbi:uncharacterized protein H6S33_011359 [Morchella sextelata]|uniref:uncharacterized protein n=1 Tax=Morchella sextelata TaxID=1174677 RepID=UPI001D05152C|nr:uncharacterized protein H6S33_011359 [Morchella sextelata]KAH0610932.1 hypothetical protein H6S33_011359 [Morchella sextelata]
MFQASVAGSIRTIETKLNLRGEPAQRTASICGLTSLHSSLAIFELNYTVSYTASPELCPNSRKALRWERKLWSRSRPKYRHSIRYPYTELWIIISYSNCKSRLKLRDLSRSSCRRALEARLFRGAHPITKLALITLESLVSHGPRSVVLKLWDSISSLS